MASIPPNLTAMLRSAAGASGKPPQKMDEQSMRLAAESVSTLSQALVVGTEAAGKVNMLSMRREQLERRGGLLQEDIAANEERAEKARKQLLEVKAARAAMGGVLADKQVRLWTAKRLDLLEKELASMRMRSDKADAKCVEMKRTVNLHRESAKAQKSLFGKLRTRLMTERARVVSALQEANDEQEDGEAIHQELEELQALNDKEQSDFKAEMDKLDKDIAALKAGVFQSAEFGKQADGEGPGSGDLTEEEEAQLRQRILTLDAQMKSVEADIRGLYEQTAQLQEIFQLMLRRAGLETLDDLIDMFSGEESNKYEQYGYIQRLNKDLKLHEARLASVITQSEHVRKEIAKSSVVWKDKLERTKAEHSILNGKIQEQTQLLNFHRHLCNRLTRVAVDAYSASGGDNPAVLGVRDLAASCDAKRSATAGGSGAAAALKLAAESKESSRSKPRTGGDDDESECPEDGHEPFRLTLVSVQQLMGATQSKVDELAMVFSNLLTLQEDRAVIVEAAKRPGSARRGRRSKLAAQGGTKPARAGATLPEVQPEEIDKMIDRFRSGPLGKVAIDGPNTMTRLPDLAPIRGSFHGRPRLGAMMSAPSVEEFDDEEVEEADTDALGMLRPVRRADIAKTTVERSVTQWRPYGSRKPSFAASPIRRASSKPQVLQESPKARLSARRTLRGSTVRPKPRGAARASVVLAVS
ncbi:hypothetical protein FNF27_01041 [Cafeteria roenbergensis]|uniref:Uncharacterized protein n=1 Tax=Cafeteria roenbergensis TaxID=33653 RepID=A0A5A8ENG6_CAFRO|nr:hypothetical protein FNF27_01041 [Cafeteria roenbergensis]